MEEISGTPFGNYKLVRRIDVGGMGEVYLAHQLTAFGRSVAIKIIRSDLVHDITARARFLREAEVSAHLKHEHILPLFDFGEVDGRLFLVTPYIEGGTLATRLQKTGPLALAEVRRLFVPLVQAIAYIHRRGVVHRDLKPTNVMLDTEDNEVYVRLIDFGIASLQGQSASPPLTVAGHEMGTVAYMAPERLSGIAAPSNDIFSLGVILHQMLTGRFPTAELAEPVSQTPRLPEPLALVVRRCVVANPAERYATADALLQSFEQAYQHITQTPVPARPAQETRAPTSRPVSAALAHSGNVSAPPPQVSGPRTFAPEDYSAPTTTFQRNQPLYQPPRPSRPPLFRPPRSRTAARRTRSRVFLLLSAAMALILIVIAGMLYFGYQVVNAASVSVRFAPRVQPISQVIIFTASPAARGTSPNPPTVRAYSLSSAKTQVQSGPTTGQINCIFFSCQPGVDPMDVTSLENRMLPALQQSISQELHSKVQSVHGTEIGTVNFSTPIPSSNPQVGQPGQSVTVSVTEQGSVGYFLNADETLVVNQVLDAKVALLGQSYQLVGSTINIGHAQTRSINPQTGVSSIAVAAAAVARYQFTRAQLQALSSALVGKPINVAQTFLKSQPGIDPDSVTIRFISGSSQSTMPADTEHITLTQMPAGLPGVQLTPVPGFTPIPTPTDIPTPAATPLPTPAENG
jgi:serine/threonine protein kinase